MGWNHHLYPVTKLFNHPQRKFCIYSKTVPHFPQPQPLQTTNLLSSSVGFSSVQSLGHVQLFATPWTEAHQGIYHSTYSIWTSLLEVQRAFLVTQRVQNLLAKEAEGNGANKSEPMCPDPQRLKRDLLLKCISIGFRSQLLL